MLLLVMGAALLMMIWALAQRFVGGTVRKNVLLAEAGRLCQIAATTAIEEGVELFTAQANESEEVDEELPDESLGVKMRQMQPGDVIEFSYRPELAEREHGDRSVEIGEVSGRMFLQGVYDERGEPPRKFNCKKYAAFLLKWSRVPG